VLVGGPFARRAGFGRDGGFGSQDAIAPITKTLASRYGGTGDGVFANAAQHAAGFDDIGDRAIDVGHRFGDARGAFRYFSAATH
jgi:hypothetical protein